MKNNGSTALQLCTTRYTVENSYLPARTVLECAQNRLPSAHQVPSTGRLRTVGYSFADLGHFIERRIRGKSENTRTWLENITKLIDANLIGLINEDSLSVLADAIRLKYESYSSTHKCYVYARAFLKYLAVVYQDDTYRSYHDLFECPMRRPSRMEMYRSTSIVTIEDVKNLLLAIGNDTSLSDDRKRTLKAIVSFLAYTGQRPVNASKITVQQVNNALSNAQPIIIVRAKQDKCNIKHEVPVHPHLISDLQYLTEGKDDNACIFNYRQLQKWLYENQFMLTECDDRFVTKHLRKFFEQYSDELGFSDVYKCYIMTHGMSGVQWTNYKRIRRESLYTQYISKWGGVAFE